jgi:uncharacterized protein YbgA (DUF1722 family)/uncharacterized protein YbbK (DUF523 family)
MIAIKAKLKEIKMIKVGISQCLMGAKVRFDGGHRANKFCNNELSKIFEFESFCPEIGIGLSIPRATIRLVGDVDAPRAVDSKSMTIDYTEQLQNFADKQVDKLKQLSGFVFCKASPSCGTNRVKVYNDKGHSQAVGMGVFAAKVQKHCPDLPIEDDGRLNDPLIRDSFIKRVYIYQEWRQLLTDGLSKHRLIKFHTRHKFTLLSHCQKTYRRLGKFIAGADSSNLESVSNRYFSQLMQGLTKVATRKNNTNVLLHLQGFFKNLLPAQDKAELRQSIMDYNQGLAPILSPLTLFKHHLSHHPIPYINQLSYLNPYPKHLGIRVKML